MKTLIVAIAAMVLIGCNETTNSVANRDRLNAAEREWYDHQSAMVQSKIDNLDTTSLKLLQSELATPLSMQAELSALCDSMNAVYSDDAIFTMQYR